MAISDYSTTDAENTTVPGSPPIELGEGIGVNPAMVQTLRRAIQRIMADLKTANGTFAGANGADGTIAGVKYTFSNSTSMANPGAGKIRFNDVSASTTIIAINEGTAASGNPDISAWINTWDDDNGGQLIVTEVGAEQNFAIFNVTGVTDNTGWHTLTVTHVASNGTLTNDGAVGVGWVKKGVKGDPGDTGATGATGATGPQGDPGSSDVTGTSASSVTIGTGTKSFTVVEADRGWAVGARLRISSDAGPSVNFMEGVITSYSGAALEVSIDRVGGSGTLADWSINLAGEPGDIDQLAGLAHTAILNSGFAAYKFVSGDDINRVHALSAMSQIFGGREDQPNHEGKNGFLSVQNGDGSTVDFSVSPGFTVNDTTWRNIRAAKRNTTTGAFSGLLTEGSGFTVQSGYGTGTVTIRFTSAPTTSEQVWIIIYGESDNAVTPTLNFIRGYDNLTGGVVSNSILSDHCMVPSGGGHNGFVGGAHNIAYGSFSAVIGGTWNILGRRLAAAGQIAIGSENQVDGTGAIAIGQANDLNGIYSVAIGYNNKSAKALSLVHGSFGEAYMAGEIVYSGGFLADTAWGLAQRRELIMRGDTTNGSITQLKCPDNSTTIIALPDNSAQFCHVQVTAIKDDGSKADAYELKCLVTKVSGTAKANNGTSAVSIPSLGSPVGSPTWTVVLLPSSGGLLVRPTGAVGENVRWVADVRLVQTRWP